MFSPIIKYPNIKAKLYGMYAKRIKLKDFEELLKQNNIKQVIEFLKSFNIEFSDSQNDTIKISLDNILISDLQKIYRQLDKSDKKTFNQFISIYEINCITNVFRKINSNNNSNFNTNEIHNWTNSIFKNLKQLENITEYNQFFNFMKKTKYKSIFTEYENDIEKRNIFELENKLEKFYFEKLMISAKSYNKELQDMIGKQIDLNNIIWIYRIKKNYSFFSSEQLRSILINVLYKLKKSEIQALIQANSEKEIIEILEKTYYAKYIDFKDIDELEILKDRYLYSLYKKIFRESVLNNCQMYAYIYMIEIENRNIMNIIEGIHYDLPKEEIRKKLVC